MSPDSSLRRSSQLPGPLIVAILVGILFLALFALEISHGLIREHGKLAKSLFAFPPVLALVWGLMTGKRWARVAARWAAGLGAAWFYFIAGLALVERPRDQFGPVWIWLLCVSLLLGSLLVLACWALGTASARQARAGLRNSPDADSPNGK